MGAEDGVDFLAGQFENLRIGEAPLAVIAGLAASINHRVVFGVGLAIDLGWQELVEGVHPHIGGKELVVALKAHPAAIDRVVVAIAESLAKAEGWGVGHVDMR